MTTITVNTWQTKQGLWKTRVRRDDRLIYVTDEHHSREHAEAQASQFIRLLPEAQELQK
jgi:uncharacterized lipoprotein YbaY